MLVANATVAKEKVMTYAACIDMPETNSSGMEQRMKVTMSLHTLSEVQLHFGRFFLSVLTVFLPN